MSYKYVNYNYTLNNCSFELPKCLGNFKGIISFSAINKDASNNPVEVTQASLGKFGILSLVLVLVLSPWQGVHVLAQS